MMRWRLVVIMALFLGFTAQIDAAEPQIDKLMKWLPVRANTVVVIAAKRIFDSEMSAREGWNGSNSKARASRPVRLPAGTEHVVMAARLTMPGLLTAWEVAVVKLAQPMSIASIARTDGGYLDTIDGREAVITDEDVYIVELKQGLMAAVHPGDRQFTSKWLGSDGDDSPGPEYLRYAVQQAADDKAAVVMAMDLTDAVVISRTLEYLEESEVLTDSGVDLFTLAETVATMRGVRLSVVIGEQAMGKMVIDFGKEITLTPRLAQLIVMEVVGESGAYISDLDRWSVKVEDKQVTLEGQLSSTGLRRVMSLVEFAGPTGESQAERIKEGLSPKASAAVDHFQEVAVLIEDLRRKDQTQSYKNIAVWMDRYAKKIDHLPIMNVDSQLQQYSAEVARQLRDGARVLQDISGNMMQDMARERKVIYSDSSRSGSYSRSRSDYARQQQRRREELQRQKLKRQQIVMQAKSRADSAIGKIMQQVDDMTRTIRMDLTEKYGVELR